MKTRLKILGLALLPFALLAQTATTTPTVTSPKYVYKQSSIQQGTGWLTDSLKRKANQYDFGRSIRQTSANLTGLIDATSYVQSLLSAGGDIYLTGTLLITKRLDVISHYTTVRGDAKLLAGPGLNELFWAENKNHLKISGLSFERAIGTTGDPISVHVKQCSDVNVSSLSCTGVLGPQTYRPAYNTATSASLCYNLRFNENTISNVGGGPYGAAITLNFCENAEASHNIITNAKNGILGWGGDADPANGENNLTGTATKWARKLKFDANIISVIEQGGLWVSMAYDVKANGNTTNDCKDVGNDTEGAENCTFSNSTINRCGNAALATFSGSKDIQFINPWISQGVTDGNAYHGYGNVPSKNVSILGGTIYTAHPTTEAIFNDDGMVTLLTIGQGLKVFSTARTATFQRVDNLKLVAPFYAETKCGNLNNLNVGILIQGGDNAQLKDIDLVYTGSTSTVAVYLLDGNSGNQTNATIDGINGKGFQLGIYNNQNRGGTGNLFLNNVIASINVDTGNPTYKNRGNRNAAGAYIDLN